MEEKGRWRRRSVEEKGRWRSRPFRLLSVDRQLLAAARESVHHLQQSDRQTVAAIPLNAQRMAERTDGRCVYKQDGGAGCPIRRRSDSAAAGADRM